MCCAAAVRVGLASAPTSRPSDQKYENRPKGIRLTYPGDWHAVKDPDYELMILPNGAANDPRHISLDVPDLPPHFPFMLQMDRIAHDYVQDLRKKHPDLKVAGESDEKLPGCVARLVHTQWHQEKQAFDDVVLVIIHANSVYLLNLQSDAPHLPATRATFDSVENSIRWTQ